MIELNYLGIHNVLAVRGDNTGNTMSLYYNDTANKYAIDLVRQIRDMNEGKYLEKLMQAEPSNFCVGVAGYPEKHFEAPNLDWDIQHLKKKVDAGADYIVTQMFFNNQAYFDFVSKCRDHGIEVPIVPGLKILTSPEHLRFLPKYFHLTIPDELTLEVVENPQYSREIGVKWAQKQSLELLEKGAPGIHYYIMGDPQPALDVIGSINVL